MSAKPEKLVDNVQKGHERNATGLIVGVLEQKLRETQALQLEMTKNLEELHSKLTYLSAQMKQA